MSLEPVRVPVAAADGHRWELIATVPAAPRAALLWLPALGMPARHYQPLADAMAAQGVAVYLHEWRGIGSSNLRAGHQCDWGYRELLTLDLPRSVEALQAHAVAGARMAIGGHSIGAQLAACLVGLQPGTFQHLWLVASGSPYWRAFPAPLRYLLPPAFQFLPWLADRRGLLHGRRLGFAGNEARTLIRDWATVGLSNRYAGRGLEVDLEAALAQVQARVQAVLLQHDRYAPAGSMRALLAKMPQATASLAVLDAQALGVPADHFAWMRQPRALAGLLLADLAAAAGTAARADILHVDA